MWVPVRQILCIVQCWLVRMKSGPGPDQAITKVIGSSEGHCGFGADLPKLDYTYSHIPINVQSCF
jgi:hypothetical protein